MSNEPETGTIFTNKGQMKQQSKKYFRIPVLSPWILSEKILCHSSLDETNVSSQK